MATIQNWIQLHDGFSPALEKINRASTAVEQKLNHLAGASRRAGNAMEEASGKSGLLGSVFKGTLGANLAMMAIDKLKDGITSLFNTSEEYAGIQARLGLVAGSQQNAAYLNEKIFESAQRARGGYLDMAKGVSQLAMSAKDAFPDPRQAVDFMEGINKLYAIGGTSGENKKFATLQLTQALGSGVLQGDEFRSISENAPIIQNVIAKTMGVSRGELKKLASEGQITADIVKRAVLENMDEINAQFENAPKLWGTQLQWLENQAVYKFGKVFESISQMATSDSIDRLIAGADKAIDYIAGGMLWLVNNAMWLAGVITDVLAGAIDFLSNNTWILYGAFLVLGAYLAFTAGMWLVNAVRMGMATAATVAKTIADMAETAAILGLILAQEGLNAAMYACPLTWIIALVVALIGVFYGVIYAVNYFAGTSINATGVIAGAFGWLFGVIRSIVAFVWNMFLTLAEFLCNVFLDPVNAIRNLFVDVWNGVVDLAKVAINEIITAINKLPGFNIDLVGENAWHGEKKYSDRMVNTTNLKMNAGFGDYDPSSYASGAYDIGATAQNAVHDMVTGIINGPEQKADEEKKKAEFDTSMIDPNANANAKNHDKTAKNTEKMAKAIEMTDEDIKALRDSAIGDTLQKWQNQHVVINVDNTINATSDADLDGFTSNLAKGLREAITVQGEGVLA